MSVSVVHVIMINVVVEKEGVVIDSVVEVMGIDLHVMIMIEDHQWYKILVSHQRL
jgi:hypothetical protein